MKYSKINRKKREEYALMVYNTMVDSFNLENNEFDEAREMSEWIKWIIEIMKNSDADIDEEDHKKMGRSLFDINYKDYKRFWGYFLYNKNKYKIDINKREIK